MYFRDILCRFKIDTRSHPYFGTEQVFDFFSEVDGKMFAVVEGGMSYYTITVDGDKVTSEEFIPDATYVDEFYACEESEDT